MKRGYKNSTWLLMLPMLLIMAISAIIPLMTVVNFSLQDSFIQGQFSWVGLDWYQEILRSERFHASLLRQIIFSFVILLIEVPLGILVALCLPRKGWFHSLCLVIIAAPLLIPLNVVGTIWQVFSRIDIGLLGHSLSLIGIDFNYALEPVSAWIAIILMDVWHWTPLVVLLVHAGLSGVPEAHYRAAFIDGASRFSIFKYVELPRLKNVLVLGILLRFMDSFIIYTEPFVLTGGGPGNSTTLLSIDLVKMATGQFDLGRAAAFSIIYFLIVLAICWVFYTVLTRKEAEQDHIKSQLN